MNDDWKLLPDSRQKRDMYYCSRAWGLKKVAVHKRSGGRCERWVQLGMNRVRCKNDGRNVHHKSGFCDYNADPEQLIHLCLKCHEFEHGISSFEPLLAQLWDRIQFLEKEFIKNDSQVRHASFCEGYDAAQREELERLSKDQIMLFRVLRYEMEHQNDHRVMLHVTGRPKQPCLDDLRGGSISFELDIKERQKDYMDEPF